MFEKILVPLDGSSFAERALMPALALAQQGHNDVTLLSVPYVKQNVVEDWSNYGYDQTLEQSQRDLTAYLERICTQMAHPNMTLHTLVTIGDEASVIVDTAVDHEIDLIVMASHGRSGFSRWMLGSVTGRVLRAAPCPVLVIREDKPLAHVMITLDGSALSEYALGPGMEIASRLGSHVTLLSVENGEALDSGLVAELEKIEPGISTQVSESVFHQTEAYLQRLARELQTDLEQMIHIVPRRGTVVEAILETIEIDKVDLVVMATHGRSGLKRWVYGSITEKVLRAARCNMLIMRPPLSELKPQSTDSEQTQQPSPAETLTQSLATAQLETETKPDDPQSAMEKAFLAEYLWYRGYRLVDLKHMPEAEVRELMTAASQYASLKLAQVESTARFREKLHRPF